MLNVRPFLNTDIPSLAQLWARLPASPYRLQWLPPSLWESTVLSRPYFDPDGLIVATEHDLPVGMIHAGFAGSPGMPQLDRSQGVICALEVVPHEQAARIAAELLRAAHRYLQRHGATKVRFGSPDTACPFYLGVLGGATNPGLPEEDEQKPAWLHAAGYAAGTRTALYRRRLPGFRPPVDRIQLQLRRQWEVCATERLPIDDWWFACTYGWSECCSFQLTARGGGPAAGSVCFWDMEPLASSNGMHARGLIALHVADPQPHNDQHCFLLGQALKCLADEGATAAEVHLPLDAAGGTTGLGPLLQRLGFEQHGCFACWTRPLDR